MYFQLNENNLSGEDDLTYKKLNEMLHWITDNFQWRHYGAYNVVNFLENIPINWSGFILDSTRFDSTEDYEMYIERLSVSFSCLVERRAQDI